MNLAILRRLVMLGNLAALAAAGYCAWDSLGSRPAPRDDKEWPKIFPVKPTVASDPGAGGPGPKEEYSAAASWSQGEKPKKEEAPKDAPPPPPPDPLAGLNLRGVFVSSEGMLSSYAQFAKGDRTFSLWVGELLPEDPGNDKSATTPWRLDELRRGGWDPAAKKMLPAAAVFHDMVDGKEAVKEVVLGSDRDPFAEGGGGDAGPQGPFRTRKPGEGLDPAQPMRARLVRSDPVKGEMEWELADGEVDWLGKFAEEQAGGIAAVPEKDAAGNPDGFTLKAVARGSRAEQYGFKPETKVISVNDEKVSSVEDAIAKGKRQYDGGTTTFVIRAIRAGKELNYTFRAPRKKPGR